jgi:hypothetical protein
LFMDIKQNYVPNPIFNRFCYDAAGLTGTFTELAGPHGNDVFGDGFIGGAPIGLGVSASDTSGGAFNTITPYFLLPSPTSLEAKVTFNFSAGALAGDAITIPFTILPPSLNANGVPEPSSWVLAATAAVVGLGCWMRRRRREAS